MLSNSCHYFLEIIISYFEPFPFAVIPAPQCIVDSDCRTTEQCHSGNCLNACYVDKCGVNAICNARQHASTCSCPPNYTGDPKKACYPSKLSICFCQQFEYHHNNLA